jgi:uncharacterized protein (TIGR02246 family)
MPAAPEDCDRLFAMRANAHDLEGLVQLYEPDAQYVRRDGSTAIGHGEIRQALRRVVEAGTAIRIEIERVVRTDSIAMIYNTWVLQTAPAGHGSSESRGRAVEIVRLQADGSWRFSIDDPFGRTA